MLTGVAPECHVVEQGWGQLKYGEMANFISHDVEALAVEAAYLLVAQYCRPDLLHAFFQHARLDL